MPVVGAETGDERAALVLPVWTQDGSCAIPPAAIPEGIKERAAAALAFATSHGFKGGRSDSILLPSIEDKGPEAIVLAGLGPRGSAGTAEVRAAAGAATRRLSAYRSVTSRIHQALEGDRAVVAAVEGSLLATYGFDTYKAESDELELQRIDFPEANEAAVERGRVAARAIALARDLTNEPPSVLTPAGLAERAAKAAEEGGMACEIWDEAELARRGCGGILGVGQGSAAPPRLIHLTYSPEGATRTVALVGKGITFDSGGLSIKDAKSMETMKTDMAGGAAVIAATYAAALLKIPVGIDAWVPAAENMLGDGAMKPGDVLTHYGGKTTEVLNTDAEGRLVLADALAIASESRPSTIVDVATLTGSMVVALGKKISGFFASDDGLRDAFIEAGREAGEDLWPFPVYEPYRRDLKSEVADQKNIATRWGGAIYAALFLSSFVGEGIPWVHLDIAGTARSESDSGYTSRGGTGVITGTLIGWLESLEQG